MSVGLLYWLSGPSNPASSGHEHRFFYLFLSIFLALKNAVGSFQAPSKLTHEYGWSMGEEKVKGFSTITITFNG